MVIDVQTGTVIVAGATLFGAAIGAFVPEYWRKKLKRHNLRVALKAEMEEMHTLAELEPDTLPEPAVTEIISTTVFEANADSIGLLSTDEVTKVTRFYSMVFWFQRELQIWEVAGEDKQKLAESNLDVLQELRMDALDAVEENL